MTETLKAKRHRETLTSIARVTAQRDASLAALLRCETKLRALRKLELRQQRALAKVAATPAAAAPQPAAIAAADDAIPAFLDRRSAGQRKDDEARAQIEARNAERKKTKAQVRIERMKAKQAGDTKRMPLTGRAALEHIKGTG